MKMHLTLAVFAGMAASASANLASRSLACALNEGRHAAKVAATGRTERDVAEMKQDVAKMISSQAVLEPVNFKNTRKVSFSFYCPDNHYDDGINETDALNAATSDDTNMQALMSASLRAVSCYAEKYSKDRCYGVIKMFFGSGSYAAPAQCLPSYGFDANAGTGSASTGAPPPATVSPSIVAPDAANDPDAYSGAPPTNPVYGKNPVSPSHPGYSKEPKPSPTYSKEPTPSPSYEKETKPSPTYSKEPTPSPSYEKEPKSSPSYNKEPKPSPSYQKQPEPEEEPQHGYTPRSPTQRNAYARDQ